MENVNKSFLAEEHFIDSLKKVKAIHEIKASYQPLKHHEKLS